MTRINAQPLFNSSTNYRIVMQGSVDLSWLQSFEISVEFAANSSRQEDDITVIDVRTDQAGIVGLVRRLHGLGITIMELQMII